MAVSNADGLDGVRRALLGMLPVEEAELLSAVPLCQLEVSVLAAAACSHHSAVLCQLKGLQEGNVSPTRTSSAGVLGMARWREHSPPLSPLSPKLDGSTRSSAAPSVEGHPGYGEQLGLKLWRCRTALEKFDVLREESGFLAAQISRTSAGHSMFSDAVEALESRANTLWELLEAAEAAAMDALRRDCDHLHRQVSLMLERLGCSPKQSQAELDRQMMEAVLKPRVQYFSDQLEKMKRQLEDKGEQTDRAEEEHRGAMAALRKAMDEEVARRDVEIGSLRHQLCQSEEAVVAARPEAERWQAQCGILVAELAESREAVRRLEEQLTVQLGEAQRQLSDLQDTLEREVSARVRCRLSGGREVDVQADLEDVPALKKRIHSLEVELVTAKGQCHDAEIRVAHLQGEVQQLSHAARRQYRGEQGTATVLPSHTLKRLHQLEVSLLEDTIARQQLREQQLKEELQASRRSSLPPELAAPSTMSVTETRLRRALAQAQAQASSAAAGESVRLVLQFEPFGQRQSRLDTL
eukprot:GGOE01037309.1.p1 GENE.GGOE01037309.1~~GGOE01037309.1.p1  ORF type:complete len:524 (+),score=168.74 GGOE01037309.1:104-1675(+)